MQILKNELIHLCFSYKTTLWIKTTFKPTSMNLARSPMNVRLILSISSLWLELITPLESKMIFWISPPSWFHMPRRSIFLLAGLCFSLYMFGFLVTILKLVLKNVWDPYVNIYIEKYELDIDTNFCEIPMKYAHIAGVLEKHYLASQIILWSVVNCLIANVP